MWMGKCLKRNDMWMGKAIKANDTLIDKEIKNDMWIWKGFKSITCEWRHHWKEMTGEWGNEFNLMYRWVGKLLKRNVRWKEIGTKE